MAGNRIHSQWSLECYLLVSSWASSFAGLNCFLDSMCWKRIWDTRLDHIHASCMWMLLVILLWSWVPLYCLTQWQHSSVTPHRQEKDLVSFSGTHQSNHTFSMLIHKKKNCNLFSIITIEKLRIITIQFWKLTGNIKSHFSKIKLYSKVVQMTNILDSVFLCVFKKTLINICLWFFYCIYNYCYVYNP